METLIFAVVSLLALGLWCDNWRMRKLANIDEAKYFILQRSLEQVRADWENEKEAAFTRGRASISYRENAPADTVFDSRDKIPAKAPAHYVPIGRRRAQAEIASMGPVTHDAKVRENNAKAMEQAG